jgi:hypothetical protein
MIIIGIGFRSESGKDTTADHFIDYVRKNTSLTIEKRSWTRSLKDICTELYGHLGLREWSFYDSPEGRALRNVKLPKIGLSPVEIWILVGKAIAGIYNETWADLVGVTSTTDIVVCPDTRRHLEASKCDYLIHVHDPRKPKREGISMDDELESFKGWHYRIINDSGLDTLRYNAETVIKDILSKIPLEKQ